MPCEYIWKLVVYVLPPINIILIGRLREPGVKSEVQMIMRIDEARHDEKSSQVNFAVSRLSGRG